ncbi:MAG: Flp pilus assembly complex ATPase component TadA, partial [Nostocales cyanobacterium W4_Combined_metabat2_030]|nr:Flp pilus assembly complex ATPase component TadA [Nostocales cyanobacterium W4_Combined_metabat2_030]
FTGSLYVLFLSANPFTTSSKVCPKSSPLFQEFKIWQILNNIQVNVKTNLTFADGLRSILRQDPNIMMI